MSRMRKRVARRIAAQQVTIRAKDNIFAVHRIGTRPVYFIREVFGDIAVIFADPKVEVISLGSPQERRERWARAEAEAEARRQRKALRKSSRT